MNTFKNFDWLPTLQATLDEKNLTTPTEIQNGAIPLMLKGQSLVAVSETGSGKTLAYALPILQILKTLENSGAKVTEASRPRAVVIVPTRELGEQVAKVFKPFTHTTRLRVRSVLGGTTFEMTRRNVAGPLEVLVATPGRLIKMLERDLIDLSDVRTLVFDEADQMLDEGFLPDAKKIVESCPAQCQRALFSATVPPTVQQLITELFTDTEVIRSRGSHKVVPTLKTVNKGVLDGKRFLVLEKILAHKINGSTLIFTNTREQCDKLSKLLKDNGHKSLIYRGEMDKVERRKNLKAFRENKVNLLISTDLASRGLDVEHVSRVINYHMPNSLENYIHRVGRTARAGREGLVINLVTDRDGSLMSKLSSIESSAR